MFLNGASLFDVSKNLPGKTPAFRKLTQGTHHPSNSTRTLLGKIDPPAIYTAPFVETGRQRGYEVEQKGILCIRLVYQPFKYRIPKLNCQRNSVTSNNCILRVIGFTLVCTGRISVATSLSAFSPPCTMPPPSPAPYSS
jgi:hypothetical protein